MRDCFIINANSAANPKNIIKGDKYRITVLTDYLVRLEYSEEGVFEDRPTQIVRNRDFGESSFTVSYEGERVTVRTQRFMVSYDGKDFSRNGLKISNYNKAGACEYVWSYGERPLDLKGTTRTLDTINGDNVKLGTGLISRYGFSVLDDSTGVAILPNGFIESRRDGIKDIYYFAYGMDFKKTIKAFYKLSGETPMLPRFALGNWWSRFYDYTQESYMKLMEKFEEDGIPLSVAVIDMDWHIVKVDPKYGHGWTGFTWNRELFPDHKALLKWLHNRNMRVTLNLHPADGIREYEECYKRIAKHMGVDTKKGEPVLFDITDENFIEYYFEDVLHPMEEEGIDFWWTDWQQGEHSKIPNLDPLWMLNHLHYLDNNRNGKRGITFSRYSGPGSHRYPVGFSGDTQITWESLKFQPYFTATASNIGYGWWSHDIGGHMNGYKDSELMTRWVQYGLYSPILRLHSTKNEFHGKEPWRYGIEAHMAIKTALRERHRLIPYLYSMNYRNYYEGEQLIEPLYYEYPLTQEAYTHPNEYFFGTELLVLPITSKRIEKLNLAKENLWLPEGIWFDTYTKRIYRGGKEFYIFRGLNEIPVFAKAGAIVPKTDDIDGKNVSENPNLLHIDFYTGENGSFMLYEDDSDTQNYKNGSYVKTNILFNGAEGENTAFTVKAAEGDLSLIPSLRKFVFEINGSSDMTEGAVLLSDGKPVEVSYSYDGFNRVFKIETGFVPTDKDLMFNAGKSAVLLKNNINEDLFKILDEAEISYDLKADIYKVLLKDIPVPEKISALFLKEEVDKNLIEALTEIMNSL